MSFDQEPTTSYSGSRSRQVHSASTDSQRMYAFLFLLSCKPAAIVVG